MEVRKVTMLEIVQQVLEIPGGWQGHLIIATLLMLGCVGFPTHTDVVMLVSGYLAAKGQMSLYYLIPIGVVIMFLGELSLFIFSRSLGKNLIAKRLKNSAKWRNHYAHVHLLLQRWGKMLFFMVRFIPGTRTATFVCTSAMGAPWKTFAIIDLIALIIWVPLVHFLGYVLQKDLESFIMSIEKWQSIIVTGIVVALVTYGVRKLIKNRLNGSPQV
jgi:membrane protein DedA with SNARE-associated domain